MECKEAIPCPPCSSPALGSAGLPLGEPLFVSQHSTELEARRANSRLPVDGLELSSIDQVALGVPREGDGTAVPYGTLGLDQFVRLSIGAVQCPRPNDYPAGYVQIQEVIRITRANGKVEEQTILHKGGKCLSPAEATAYLAAQLAK